MMSFTMGVDVLFMPYNAVVVVSGDTKECPTVHVYEELFCSLGTGHTASATDIDTNVDDLYDAAFLLACQQEEEDLYETIEASEIGF